MFLLVLILKMILLISSYKNERFINRKRPIGKKRGGFNMKKPHISQRETLSGCIGSVCGLKSSEELELRLSLVPNESSGLDVAPPVKSRSGDSFYMQTRGCPYRQCPNALASMTMEGPDAGDVISLCANLSVARVYMSLLKDDGNGYKN